MRWLRLAAGSAELGGVIVSYDETGEPVCVEFLNASKRKLIHPGETSLPIQTQAF